MYYGSLRYWLYTVYMTPSVRRRVQAEADILLWSKTPDLEAEPKRYRRYNAKPRQWISAARTVTLIENAFTLLVTEKILWFKKK